MKFIVMYATGTYSQLSKITSEIYIFYFRYLSTGHPVQVSKNCRTRGYFSKPKRISEQKCLGNICLYNIKVFFGLYPRMLKILIRISVNKLHRRRPTSKFILRVLRKVLHKNQTKYYLKRAGKYNDNACVVSVGTGFESESDNRVLLLKFVAIFAGFFS